MLNRWRVMWMVSAVMLLMVGSAVAQTPTDDATDLLIYSTTIRGNKSLWLYDPYHETNKPLLPDIEVINFDLAADRKLAFVADHEGSAEVYVLDDVFAKHPPINISQSPFTSDYVLGWSPDGQYLAFESRQEGLTSLIYVWDGKEIINITPSDMSAERYSWPSWSPAGQQMVFKSLLSDKSERLHHWNEEMVVNIIPDDINQPILFRTLKWSQDGRLAFSIGSDDLPTEIYLWDGNTTVNVSQNPTFSDDCPAWNNDGRLSFISGKALKYDIVIWDGTSFKNGVPDTYTFAHLGLGQACYYSYPTWTNDGRLGFTLQNEWDKHRQVYVWGGETVINISQNPAFHNATPEWHSDGRWAFYTYDTREPVVYVRDALGRTLLKTEGIYPAWSSDGNLMFCRQSRLGGWGLAVWDGHKIVELTHGDPIRATWQSGGGLGCSSG